MTKFDLLEKENFLSATQIINVNRLIYAGIAEAEQMIVDVINYCVNLDSSPNPLLREHFWRKIRLLRDMFIKFYQLNELGKDQEAISTIIRVANKIINIRQSIRQEIGELCESIWPPSGTFNQVLPKLAVCQAINVITTSCPRTLPANTDEAVSCAALMREQYAQSIYNSKSFDLEAVTQLISSLESHVYLTLYSNRYLSSKIFDNVIVCLNGLIISFYIPGEFHLRFLTTVQTFNILDYKLLVYFSECQACMNATIDNVMLCSCIYPPHYNILGYNVFQTAINNIIDSIMYLKQRLIYNINSCKSAINILKKCREKVCDLIGFVKYCSIKCAFPSDRIDFNFDLFFKDINEFSVDSFISGSTIGSFKNSHGQSLIGSLRASNAMLHKLERYSSIIEDSHSAMITYSVNLASPVGSCETLNVDGYTEVAESLSSDCSAKHENSSLFLATQTVDNSQLDSNYTILNENLLKLYRHLRSLESSFADLLETSLHELECVNDESILEECYVFMLLIAAKISRNAFMNCIYEQATLVSNSTVPNAGLIYNELYKLSYDEIKDSGDFDVSHLNTKSGNWHEIYLKYFSHPEHDSVAEKYPLLRDFIPFSCLFNEEILPLHNDVLKLSFFPGYNMSLFTDYFVDTKLPSICTMSFIYSNLSGELTLLLSPLNLILSDACDVELRGKAMSISRLSEIVHIDESSGVVSPLSSVNCNFIRDHGIQISVYLDKAVTVLSQLVYIVLELSFSRIITRSVGNSSLTGINDSCSSYLVSVLDSEVELGAYDLSSVRLVRTLTDLSVCFGAYTLQIKINILSGELSLSSLNSSLLFEENEDFICRLTTLMVSCQLEKFLLKFIQVSKYMDTL